MVFLNCSPMHKMYKLLLLLTVIQETSSPGKCANDRIFLALLRFLAIFPQRLKIFKENFSRLLYVHIYAKFC